MWQFLDKWLVLSQVWSYPLMVCLATCTLTFVVYRIYTSLSIWLYKRSRYVLYAFIEAICPPLLVFIWILSLRLIYRMVPNLSFLLLAESRMVDLHEVIMLMLATWCMMRFISSMQSAVSFDYMKNKKMMNFLFRLFYYILILLSTVGFLGLLGITLSEKLTAVGHSFIILNFVIVLLYFSHAVFTEYAKVFAAENLFFRQTVIQALRGPIKLLIAGIGLNFIIKTWQNLGYLAAIKQLFAVVHYWEIALMSFFWMLYRFTSLVEQHLLLGHLTEKYPDKVMVQTSSKFIRAVIIIMALCIFFARIRSNAIFTLFGGSAVFFGIVGKDIFPNYLSGFVIYLEDRLKIGDSVYSVDQQIEGHVESIDLRSTSIRTFDKKLLIVPNNLLISNAFYNASKMTNRRIRETIRVERVSHDRLAEIIQDMRVMLENHPGIDHEQKRMVHFIKFGTYSLDIDLYTFTKTVDLKTYRNVQQDVFLKVMEIIDKNGARLAFPTRTLHVEEPQAKKVEVLS